MFNKEKIRKELESVPNDELKESVRRLLYKKDLPEGDVFSLKILIIEELIRRGKLNVLLDNPSGEPYKTRVETLKPQDMDLILKQFLYHSIPLECIIRAEEVIFNHIETT
ncbi:MAG: hypothetical protein WC938_02240 [Candidatus Paceibacterota bacterium]|jgi:hypothetical protein